MKYPDFESGCYCNLIEIEQVYHLPDLADLWRRVYSDYEHGNNELFNMKANEYTIKYANGMVKYSSINEQNLAGEINQKINNCENELNQLIIFKTGRIYQ